MDESKFSLNAIKYPTDSINEIADEKTAAQMNDIYLEREKIRTQGLSDILKQRRKIADIVLFTTIIWLGSVTLIVLFQGFNPWGFNLTNSTMNILIGSTTANIVGLLIIILKFVFNPKDYLL